MSLDLSSKVLDRSVRDAVAVELVLATIILSPRLFWPPSVEGASVLAVSITDILTLHKRMAWLVH